MKKRPPEEFVEALEKNKSITRWNINDCDLCGYQCGYVFDHENKSIIYDSGCYCVTYSGWRQADPQDLADHYNLQNSDSVIKIYDEFWGFDD